ncbi:MAG TPA: recombinase family protein [Steroidobacteraceae bacterium]|jgi:DNA invertase Pin-like site-specific DNA recombinase
MQDITGASVMGKPLRVGIYLRVSTAGQTVENQRQDLQRVAEQRGWQVVGEYVDHGISGNKGRDKRPQFDQLAKDAVQGRLDLVAAWSIDRVGRSLGHLVEFMDELRAQNVGLYLHQQQIDTSTAAGRAFLQMAGVFAEFERAVIVERVRAGLARARTSGTRSGRPIGRPPVSGHVTRRIKALRRAGHGKLWIAKEIRCGVGTVSRVLAETVPRKPSGPVGPLYAEPIGKLTP